MYIVPKNENDDMSSAYLEKLVQRQGQRESRARKVYRQKDVAGREHSAGRLDDLGRDVARIRGGDDVSRLCGPYGNVEQRNYHRRGGRRQQMDAAYEDRYSPFEQYVVGQKQQSAAYQHLHGVYNRLFHFRDVMLCAMLFSRGR